ncbi:protein Brevis radix-like 4 [Impatiens glandulifera]|uniref:protein Brevis radix-like 4 n=1 Tax=Impatiens glandulifera TaxID=253017 RepID=UPI001FB15921|nr:protein Brevis radix-like 4 [Impatiens glandulifera]
MLTCIARAKQPGDGSHTFPEEFDNGMPDNKQAVKSLTNQIKDMALKASGAYRNCAPCTGPDRPVAKQQSGGFIDSGSLSASSDRFRWSYRRTTSSNSSSKQWGKEMEARLKGISSWSSERSTAVTSSGRRVDPVVFIEESEPKEWVAQVEPGVLITFLSMPRGGNDLKRIRFSREMFNKWQAQKWWTENYEKVMELYNVQKLNKQAFSLPIPPPSEDENSKFESVNGSPVTPDLSKERHPHNSRTAKGTVYSSLDSFENHVRQNCDSAPTSTPKLSSISGTKTDISSVDASMSTCSSRDQADRSGELSISTVSDLETEWVEQDEPGVYLTIKALPGGKRELRRVRFSREKFGEVHARLWWEENRGRVHKQYL